MIEYGNYFHKEDIQYHPLDGGNYLALAVQRARNTNDSKKRIICVRDAVQTLFREAKDRGVAKFGTVKFGIHSIIYAIFDYNGHVYYWWEKYLNDSELQKGYNQGVLSYDLKHGIENAHEDAWCASEEVIDNCVYTLEYPFRANPIVTYVGFSSNPTQSPLICVSEYFKTIKLK